MLVSTEEINQINMGQSPPSESYNQNKKGLPFYQGKTEFGETYPNPVKWCSAPKKIANKGDILISVRAPVGPTNMCKEKSCIGRGLAAISPVKGVESKYIFYVFRSLESKISSLGTGTTFQAISGKVLRSIKIPLAPLPEQRAIVGKIEQLFSDLDNGIANLKQAREQLKVYRQAVLKKAFEGELTKEWREKQTNLPSAEELLEQIKAEREKHYAEQLESWKQAVTDWEAKDKPGKKPAKPRKLDINVTDRYKSCLCFPVSWGQCQVADVISDLTDYHANGSYVKLKENVQLSDEPNYAIMVRATNFEKNDFEKGLKYIDKHAYNFLSKSKLYGGEILIGKIGNAGKVYLMHDLKRKASLAMNLFALRTDYINSNYLYYQLISSTQKSEINSYVKGVGNPTIDKISIRSIHIVICSQEEQKQVVKEIEKCLSVCDNVEANIEAALQQSEALRQSILKKAFEGKLLTDSELAACRLEPDYEPAEKLLQRIKSEKEGK